MISLKNYTMMRSCTRSRALLSSSDQRCHQTSLKLSRACSPNCSAKHNVWMAAMMRVMESLQVQAILVWKARVPGLPQAQMLPMCHRKMHSMAQPHLLRPQHPGRALMEPRLRHLHQCPASRMLHLHLRRPCLDLEAVHLRPHRLCLALMVPHLPLHLLRLAWEVRLLLRLLQALHLCLVRCTVASCPSKSTMLLALR